MEQKLTKTSLTCTWTAQDVKNVAKTLKLTLTSAEIAKVLSTLASFTSESTEGPDCLFAEIIRALRDNGSHETVQDSPPNDLGNFGWYYHTKGKNQTKEAVTAALYANRPMLIMACKPNCDVCKLVWDKYLCGNTKMADWLKKNKVVGLKIDDTANHYTTLSKNKNKYTGIDGVKGNKINSTAPFFTFVKLSDKASKVSSITLDSKTGEIDTYLSGFGNAKADAKTYDAVTSWLESIMNMSAFKKLF